MKNVRNCEGGLFLASQVDQQKIELSAISMQATDNKYLKMPHKALLRSFIGRMKNIVCERMRRKTTKQLHPRRCLEQIGKTNQLKKRR